MGILSIQHGYHDFLVSTAMRMSNLLRSPFLLSLRSVLHGGQITSPEDGSFFFSSLPASSLGHVVRLGG
jgi:hypothetical protein